MKSRFRDPGQGGSGGVAPPMVRLRFSNADGNMSLFCGGAESGGAIGPKRPCGLRAGNNAKDLGVIRRTKFKFDFNRGGYGDG